MALASKARSALAVVRIRPFDTSSEFGRSQERLRRVALTALSSTLARLVGAICSLATVRLALEYLGAERYGLWMTLTALFGMLASLDLGIGNGLLTAISQADGRNSREEAQQVVSSGFFLLVSVAGLFLLAVGAAFVWIPWETVLNAGASAPTLEIRYAVAALIVTTAVALPLSTVTRVQMGFQEGFSAHLWVALGTVLTAIAAWACALTRAPFAALAFACALGPVVAAAINWGCYFRWSRPWLRPSLSQANAGMVWRLANLSGQFLLLQLFLILGTATDSLFIAHRFGHAAVAEYSVVHRLFLLALIVQVLIAPLWPAFGEAMAREDYGWARLALRRSLKLAVIAGVVSGIGFALLCGPVIRLWLGSHAILPSTPLILGFSAWILVGSAGGVLSTFLNSGPLLAAQIRIFGAASATALALKPLLIGPLGAGGVVWATVIGHGLLFVIPGIRLAYDNLGRLERSSMSLPAAPPQ